MLIIIADDEDDDGDGIDDEDEDWDGDGLTNEGNEYFLLYTFTTNTLMM